MVPLNPPVLAWLTWQATPGTLGSSKALTQTRSFLPMSRKQVLTHARSSARAPPIACSNEKATVAARNIVRMFEILRGGGSLAIEPGGLRDGLAKLRAIGNLCPGCSQQIVRWREASSTGAASSVNLTGKLVQAEILVSVAQQLPSPRLAAAGLLSVPANLACRTQAGRRLGRP